MKLKILAILLFTGNALLVFAQAKKNEIKALRITQRIEIDGKLNDLSWRDAPVSDNFIGHQPISGKSPRFKTKMRVLYDDNAMYFGFTCYDDSPDSISTVLAPREGFLDVFLPVSRPYAHVIEDITG